MRRPAFTIVELLVVVAIMLAITGLLLPAVQKVRDSAHRRTVACDFAKFEVAIKDYRALHGRYPKSLAAVAADVPLRDGVYVDPWGTPYAYSPPRQLAPFAPSNPNRKTTPTASGLRFVSAGPDRRFRSHDDIPFAK